MTLVILNMGDPPESVASRRGDFARFIRETIGTAWTGDVRVVDARVEPLLPNPREASAFVLTGSASSVTERAPWMLRAEEHVRRIVAAGTPLLGICFGHQLIASALGGRVERNPLGREIGTVRATLVADDPLFEGAPRAIAVSSSHVDVVTRAPDGARRLATTGKDDHAALAIGDRVRSVQFHPELDGDIVRGYVDARRAIIASEGGDPEAILAAVTDAPHGAAVLPRFFRHFVAPPAASR